MSTRVLAFRLAAVLLFTGLLFGAAPAKAGGFGCGNCYVAPVWGCGCGTSYYFLPRPHYYFNSGCGGCGVRYVLPRPYYSSWRSGAYVVEPQFERSPIYYGGERIYRRAAVHYRYHRGFVRSRVRHVAHVRRAAFHRHYRVYR